MFEKGESLCVWGGITPEKVILSSNVGEQQALGVQWEEIHITRAIWRNS